MDKKVLYELFPFLNHHRIHDQSETRLDALSRMYIALNDLICVLSIDDYESRRKITRKINALYQVIDRSSIKNLRRMYRLTKEVSMAVYGERDEECSKLYYELINRYLDCSDPEVELDIMRCIVYELSNIMEDKTEFDFYPYFQKKCRQWISELDKEGCWKGVSSEMALRRLELLQDNSCVFRDDSFNVELSRIYNYYKKRLMVPEQIMTEDLPLFGAWYDLLRISGVWPDERILLRRIGQLMENYAATVPFRSDSWYFATGYAVMQCCTDILDDVQREMMQRAG